MNARQPSRVHRGLRSLRRTLLLAIFVIVLNPLAGRAQGILTLIPGRSITTSAGEGGSGYAGDGGRAMLANLSRPGGMVYDAGGNLFVADTDNHVVRELLITGAIKTVAGTGVEGFAGDGGPATSAELDTPTGVALDADSNLYIADSHNHRIRRVSGATITSVAGNGMAGFGGDGSSAIAAELFLPTAVATRGSDLYISDTGNQRIRKVTGSIITTFAGNGEESYAGDDGPAIDASLDAPSGLAIDAAGRVYVADCHNQRIRMVDLSGTISTFAGSGIAGGAGDGAAALSAFFFKPRDVWVDGSSNVWIADTGNQRIREVSKGLVTTVVGTGVQGFAGDGAVATSSILNEPRAVGMDGSGVIAIADSLNQRIRSSSLPVITFPSQMLGADAAPQFVTLKNTGSAPIAISSVAFSGDFSNASGGTCPAVPITLSPGAACMQAISFHPAASGISNGSVAVSGNDVVAQTILLVGSAALSSSTTTLATTGAVLVLGQTVTFTATVKAETGAPLTGSVTFYDGSMVLGTQQSLSSQGVASFTSSALGDGKHTILATYTGSATAAQSTSSVLIESVADFTVAPSSGQAGSSGEETETVTAGQSAAFDLTIASVAGTSSIPVSFSATGLPSGATAVFTPAKVSLGANSVSVSMVIQTVTGNALLRSTDRLGLFAIALFVLPFRRPFRRPSRLRCSGIFLVAGLISFGIVAGCGGSKPGSGEKTYHIDIVASATSPGGATLQHTTNVTLIVK